MSTVPSGLADPPGDLRDFPAAGAAPEMHRLSEWPGSWWFASVEGDDAPGGRFDLTAPLGTCYLAEGDVRGALVEKLLRLPTKVVVAERLQELFHTVVTVRSDPPTADLTAAAATGFGLNAELHTTTDYTRPRRWARALYRAGWRGVRHRLRGDPTQTLAGRALFGSAGLHRRAPAGMRTTARPLDTDLAARLLTELGVEVRPIPAQVPIISPGP
jgi:hypothetical protein